MMGKGMMMMMMLMMMMVVVVVAMIMATYAAYDLLVAVPYFGRWELIEIRAFDASWQGS